MLKSAVSLFFLVCISQWDIRERPSRIVAHRVLHLLRRRRVGPVFFVGFTTLDPFAEIQRILFVDRHRCDFALKKAKVKTRIAQRSELRAEQRLVRRGASAVAPGGPENGLTDNVDSRGPTVSSAALDLSLR